MIAFDPSCISGSGKHTPGVGYFWSGCAGKAKWGVELCGFTAVGIKTNMANSLNHCNYYAACTFNFSASRRCFFSA